MRPTVLLDCDGVMADFSQAIFDIIEEISGKKYTHEDVTEWEIFDSLKDVKHLQRAVYDEIKLRGNCGKIPVYSGAVDGVKKLQSIAHVVIVTAPFFGSPTWAHERELWLQGYFGIDPHDVIHARTKRHVVGDFFIDDKPAHVEDWRRTHGAGGYLWDCPSNKSSPLPRVRGWQDLYDKVYEYSRRSD